MSKVALLRQRLRKVARFTKSPEIALLLSSMALAASTAPIVWTMIPRPSLALKIPRQALRLSGPEAGSATHAITCDAELVLLNTGNRDAVLTSFYAILKGELNERFANYASQSQVTPAIPLLLKAGETQILRAHVTFTDFVESERKELETFRDTTNDFAIHFRVGSMNSSGREYEFSYPAILIRHNQADSGVPLPQWNLVDISFQRNIMRDKTLTSRDSPWPGAAMGPR